ncbi:MAG TPA: hypothetical protein DDX39_12780 [Bacteroidales bacterium]|nr:MAG: hypothetical protein A2W98_02520 [Bacteroidetes bacterium GWF2_33_38]OFY92008.1 MAG: hypothetical protein A2236_11195 [Bacteroidetes bacterium RIFOXYA2_FULL_33_7]HBF89507.1 hypothetical protein [Bacteroidales bacterium]
MKEDYIYIIEEYLNNNLSSNERTKVEQLLKTDKDFSNKLYLTKDLNEKLSNRKTREFYLNLKKMSQT